MSYPRETVEYVTLESVQVNGTEVTSGVSYALTTGSDRPTDWQALITVDGKLGFLLDTPEPGVYHVWVKVTDTPEAPVIKAGTFVVD